MSGERPLSLEQTEALLALDHAYVDVRSEIEFEQGHVPGAFNVPFMQPHHDELLPNPDFLAVMEACFSKDAALILGCHSGTRARLAAELLRKAEFTRVHELSVGWNGSRDAFGRLEPGWSRRGLPVEHGGGEARSYAVLKRRAELDPANDERP